MADGGAARRLPPLNALRVFEVAGRLCSIRGAAAELVVTPGAVSRQVRALESWLGVDLFRHEGRALQLTEPGARYLEAVSEHLGAIAAATADVTGERPESALHVRSYTLFATNWLIPRLTGFHRGQPWVELELTTSSRPPDFGRGDADAEIRSGSMPHHPGTSGRGPRDGWSGYETDLVLSTELALVCSSSYRDERRLVEPADLATLGGEEFLRSTASPKLWPMWLAAAGVEGARADRGPSFSDSVLTCRAAAAGQGVAIAPVTFVETDLAAGRLVAPFADGPDLRTDFFLVYPADSVRRRAFRAFREWLLAEAVRRDDQPASA